MTEKVRVTASEFHRSFGALSDKALKETISITKGRDHLVLMSAEEYERLKRGRRVGLAEDFPEPALELAKRVRMSRRHRHLDAELKN